MKIRSIKLQNYKRFVQSKSLVFTDSSGAINNKVLLVGDNGSGKSSILQAIVAVVASMTRAGFKPDSLDWPGYEYRHLQTGKLPLQVEVEVCFSEKELTTTLELSEAMKKMGVNIDAPSPTRHRIVTLKLDFEKKQVTYEGINGESPLNQFGGHFMATYLSRLAPNKSSLFENVGNIYWYHEQRTSFDLSQLADAEVPQIDFLRLFLASAYGYHMAVESGERSPKEGEFDFYAKLESTYKKVFPGRSFVGAAPRFDIYEKSRTPDFFLSDGENQYELSGMSAGERAIFPILMEFTRWNINNSIILIDELELHLHPPLQQMLVRVLPQLGNDNQFIFTTHSDSVAAMFDETENEIIRL